MTHALANAGCPLVRPSQLNSLLLRGRGAAGVRPSWRRSFSLVVAFWGSQVSVIYASVKGLSAASLDSPPPLYTNFESTGAIATVDHANSAFKKEP